MHVAVDAANLARDRRGIGRYARALVSRWLRMRDRVRVTLLVPDLIPAVAKRRLAAALDAGDLDVRRRQQVAALIPDLVWYPWNGMTWVSPRINVATVHDVWPFVSPAGDLRVRRREQIPYQTTAARTSAIIANSQFTKSELVRHLRVPADRVHVIHMGVDAPAPFLGAPVKLAGAQRYVLFVGESEPRKDPTSLRAAMAKLPEELRATTGLVMAGKATRSTARCGLIETRRGKDTDPPVLRFASGPSFPMLVPGEVSEAVLQRLYAGAAAFAFPSRYEGFGLPVLEAMARGVPVIASNAASIPEVGADAVLYFPPGDSDALAAALTRVLGDGALAARLGAAGIARAVTLSWDRCSDETLDLLERVSGVSAA